MNSPPSPSDAVSGTTAEHVYATARKLLGEDRLFVIVSNREPYEHVSKGGRTVAQRTVGGVVSALDPLMERLGGTWIAWGSGAADRSMVDTTDGVLLPPGKETYRLRRIWMSEEEVEHFYRGHVNQTLWPLCHSETEKVRFRRQEWDVYQTINRRFAEAAAEELKEKKGVVWFHDYQFATAPGMLRDLLPEVTILQFWHIPWPPWEIFRRHPQRRALLEGLLGCDLIGMHIDQYCDNFLQCVERELHLPVDWEKGHVLVGNRMVRIRALPISIDAQHWADLAASVPVQRALEKYRTLYAPAGRAIGIGVERADYTKGILLRLHALELLFEQYPQWRGTFTFLQVTPSSRSAIRAYALFQQEMIRVVRAINARYQTDTWKPIVHIRTAIPEKDLAALYRLASIGVVSVRQDGMNLVAKEFVACRTHEDGALVLSEFAGVSEELHEAIAINPYDVEGFAYALHQGLSMPVAEQHTHMQRLREHLFSHTIYDWVQDLLEEVAAVQQAQEGAGSAEPLLDHLDDLQERMAKHRHFELFCDYDGVLTSIAPRPREARLNERVRDLLCKLRDSASVHVSIISGRMLTDIVELVSIERLTYAGNHGLEISGPRVKRIHPDVERVHGVLKTLYDTLRSTMRPFPGVLVEDKELGIAVHFRLVPTEQRQDVANVFYAQVQQAVDEGLLRVTTGKFVLEVRPNVAWDKGTAALWLLEQLHGSDWRGRVLPFYLGDDETDEDAFLALLGSGVTIRVGDRRTEPTAAQYVVRDTGDVTVFLEWLAQTVR
ncbi:MAG: bifunctional alpha,alpha-trehalose-phosphate synthase (UDP-forming)/trehalose-phosphatase [Candidatus Peribacteraceae bacterium]|nr:bifunctional alpha,alpha-trehalose-phosphate synthase (UDP-forming)/trehalose-phosphatase [Candidatus Peribacteraceae bacterium]